MFSKTKDIHLHALHLAILSNLESVLYLGNIEFLSVTAIDNSDMNAENNPMP